MSDIRTTFTPEDWARIDRDWAAWWAGELDRPLLTTAFADPAAPPLPAEKRPKYFAAQYPLDMPADEIIDREQAMIERRHYLGDAYPKWFVNFGPGVIAGFTGARVGVAENTVWFEPAEEKAIGDIHLEYDADNVWWKRVRELTARAAERWGKEVAVSHSDIGGNMDILASFRTTEGLLMDLYDAPEEVTRVVGEITNLWKRYYDELAEIILPACGGTTSWAIPRSKGRTYMLQCDFSYMISPDMFEQFILPDLAACCDHLDHAFYHLDGKGQIPHLDHMLSLERLHGIQWIPGAGQPTAESWMPLLKRIRDAGKLCEVHVGVEAAKKIIRELGGKGFVFCLHIPECTLEAANDALEMLLKEAAEKK